MTTVTRFAPSPTGYLHIGGARTALFSWLLAKSQGGTFLLRVEDTDRERSTQEATDAIIEAMAWLDLAAEGTAVFQSERFDLYNSYIDQLLAAGRAYWCSCTPEEVEAMREKARAEGKKPKYDGRCRELGLGPGAGRVVRFKTPQDGVTAFVDKVKGPTAVQNSELDDMILRRSDGAPTYNLAVVVDDHDMGVTHVLRGDDHVANTPRQILLYQAFGWDVPSFGHVPMILGPDKAKLSKRHGALSVMEYKKLGYLPEALVNYLARLGWACGDQEIFSREELVKLFPAGNLGNSPSVFDMKKLEWLNAHYIKESAPERLAALLPEFLGDTDGLNLDPAYLASIIPLLQPRAKTLVEMADMARFFLLPTDKLVYDEKAVADQLKPEARALLAELLPIYEEASDYTDHKALETATQAFLDARELKFKAVAQPLRVALTGKTASPGLFETMCVLGKAESLARIKRALSL
ncbi:MAG: glutamate--tRNA ligase [Humidesulfovibrio sp.]|uniref:glutamate--tRNA ligase n=1 Tax=Humidesulfovibrio sp. TaxID=2910988 RepID=UPI0027FD2268|nr:glutamate--tRNA ligase [Humidesulfovibrio sp.]MDQ7834585.1 glutamate--tRNA ligase [Humidesulfovibrio sp.]